MLDHQQIKQLAETACRKNVEAEEMVGPFIVMGVVTEPFEVAMLYCTEIEIFYPGPLAYLCVKAVVITFVVSVIPFIPHIVFPHVQETELSSLRSQLNTYIEERERYKIRLILLPSAFLINNLIDQTISNMGVWVGSDPELLFLCLQLGRGDQPEAVWDGRCSCGCWEVAPERAVADRWDWKVQGKLLSH
jgi:hypothetical protein